MHLHLPGMCPLRHSRILLLPSSNVLYYDLSDDAWLCVRPSGTEPKIKFYMGVKGISLEDADKKLNELESAMREIAG